MKIRWFIFYSFINLIHLSIRAGANINRASPYIFSTKNKKEELKLCQDTNQQPES